MSSGGRLAVMGLGAMGLPIAAKLLEAGFDVVGVDVAEEARRRFAELGASTVAGAGAVPSDVGAVLILVVTADQVRAVLFGEGGLADRLAPGTIVIVSATIGPRDARDIAARLAARGLRPVEAPVSGGVKRARRGDLSVIVAGDPRDVARARPILAPISREMFDAGPGFGSACTIKLLNQMLCGVHLAIAAETVQLAERLGLNQDLLYRVVTQSSGSSHMFADRVPQMRSPPAETNSAVDVFLKDLRLALEAGRDAGAPTMLTAAAEAVFAGASAAGLGATNDSQIIRWLRGLHPDSVEREARSEDEDVAVVQRA
jgi:3-hydroxyisobutyrate dehydrogenase-like beta-hydroxyacid dehydrogenase